MIFCNYHISYHIAGVCEVDSITGNFKNDNGNVTLDFSAGHPDVTYTCKIDSKKFEPCKLLW